MTTGLSTTYTLLHSFKSIYITKLRKELLELRNFEKVKLKLYTAKVYKTF